MTARALVKGALERLLVLSREGPRRMRGRSLILAYHNVVPDKDQAFGDRSLHLPLSRFQMQLDLLQAHCAIVPLQDLLKGSTDAERPKVAITFDDAYAGAVTLALPELQRRGVAGTLFVAPGLLGAPALWWDEIARREGTLRPKIRQRALTDQAGSQARIMTSLPPPSPGPAALPRSYRCATEEEVRAAGSLAGITLGAHTWSHPNLTALDADTLASELTRPLAWLAGLTGCRVAPILAYPYGLTSTSVEEAARAAGYSACLLVEGGWLTPGADRVMAIPRLNVPAGISADGFLLRLAGLRP